MFLQLYAYINKVKFCLNKWKLEQKDSFDYNPSKDKQIIFFLRFWVVICLYLQVRLLCQILQFLEYYQTCFQWVLIRYISLYLFLPVVLYGLAYINFCLPVFLLKMPQFSALPMMPIQAMTQQVEKDILVIYW